MHNSTTAGEATARDHRAQEELPSFAPLFRTANRVSVQASSTCLHDLINHVDDMYSELRVRNTGHVEA